VSTEGEISLILELQNITKSFSGTQVLTGINFRAESGKALGLLGRNGAGKTTSIRIMIGLFAADGGQVLLDGKPIDREKVSMGYLAEERGMYPKIKIGEQMEYIGRLRGMSAADAKASTEKWLARLGMSETYSKKLDTLSKGNQQKIQLAATLLHNPQIIILDEPFSGLDPVNAQLLKEVVNEQTAAGKILIFSSHQMSQVEEFCNDIALINKGQIVLSGSLREIKRGYDRTSIYVQGNGGADLEPLLQNLHLPMIKSITQKDDGIVAKVFAPEDKDALLQAMVGQGIQLEHFEVLEPTLEEIFVEKVG